MLIALAVVGWIVCGALAYGVEKDWYRKFELETKLILKHYNIPYIYRGRSVETGCVMVGLLGPIGLCIASVMALMMDRKIQLTYRMPKELFAERK